MNILKYKSSTGSIFELPASEAIGEAPNFTRDGVSYSLLSSYLPAYLMHKYCPMMNFFPINLEGKELSHTYAELYAIDPYHCHQTIQWFIGPESFKKTVEGFINSLDKLEQQCKEYDAYINGQINY